MENLALSYILSFCYNDKSTSRFCLWLLNDVPVSLLVPYMAKFTPLQLFHPAVPPAQLCCQEEPALCHQLEAPELSPFPGTCIPHGKGCKSRARTVPCSPGALSHLPCPWGPCRLCKHRPQTCAVCDKLGTSRSFLLPGGLKLLCWEVHRVFCV